MLQHVGGEELLAELVDGGIEREKEREPAGCRRLRGASGVCEVRLGGGLLRCRSREAARGGSRWRVPRTRAL